MWVPAADCRIWQELTGETSPLPVAPPQERDDEISRVRCRLRRAGLPDLGAGAVHGVPTADAAVQP